MERFFGGAGGSYPGLGQEGAALKCAMDRNTIFDLFPLQLTVANFSKSRYEQGFGSFFAYWPLLGFGFTLPKDFTDATVSKTM